MPTALDQPERDDIDLSRVLRALSDPSRRSILRSLASGPKPCSAFELDLAKSTLSQHLKILRESGLTHTEAEGRNHMTTLRRQDIETRFPGLLQSTGILTPRNPASVPRNTTDNAIHDAE